MPSRSPRLAARALILQGDKLLVVNAYPDGKSDLWCAPGGGVEKGFSVPENLRREVYEETGLQVSVGAPCLVNEFHDPVSGFHQVEVFFRCKIIAGEIAESWQDPENIVTMRQFVTRTELETLRFKPDSLPHVAWGRGMGYDPLEVIVT